MMIGRARGTASRRLPTGLAFMTVLALVGALVSVSPAKASTATAAPARASTAAASTAPLTNLGHIDFLGDTVTPPAQPGHTTYNLATEPSIGVLWTYAEPDGSGGFRRLGGGTYDPATNTYGQGAFNTDDLTRAAVVYLRHWRQFGDAHSRAFAYELLRAVTYMQTLTNDGRLGNFVLWMQPDGTLHPSVPGDNPDPSDAGASYWLARSIWALGEGYAAFSGSDPSFAAFLRDRLTLARQALEREVLVNYRTYRVLDGLRVPAWLIVDGADASSEAIYGLAAYVRARPGDAAARRDLAQLADGVARMSVGTPVSVWPFGAILPWAGSRSDWHAWGDQMSGALATASSVLDDRSLLDVAVREEASLAPHVIVQGGAEQGWLPAPADRAQIAYGAEATVENLVRTSDASGLDGFRKLAAVEAAWYFGNNRSGVQMYDPATGVTFDGLEADGRVNANSGAESTIMGLLSMLALDARPDVAAAATGRNERTAQLSWALLEAESGTLSGRAQVVTPASAWTGESLWSGGKYVEFLPGSSDSITATLPETGRYRVLPVFDHQQAPFDSVGLRFKMATVPLGVNFEGGAGAQGVSPTSGYLDIGNVGSNRVMPAGTTSIAASYVGDGRAARLDAVLVQPEIERLQLAGRTGSQGLLRSWSTTGRSTTIQTGSRNVTAWVYDGGGRLVTIVHGFGSVSLPVQPYGFTYYMGT